MGFRLFYDQRMEGKRSLIHIMATPAHVRKSDPPFAHWVEQGLFGFQYSGIQ